jgi:hypothetical protein
MVSIVAVASLFIAFFAMPVYLWTGVCNVDVHFIAVDSKSQQTVSGVYIDINTYDNKKIRLTTDDKGRAIYRVHDCPSSGESDLLGIRDSFSIRLPSWDYQVSASGYAPMEINSLRALPSHSVRRTGSRAAQVDVLIELRQ